MAYFEGFKLRKSVRLKHDLDFKRTLTGHVLILHKLFKYMVVVILVVREAVFDWLEEAKEELETAKQLYKMKRYAHSCFHAQQAVEKALKAIIIHVKRVIHRSHDLVELYGEVKDVLHVNSSIESCLPELSAYYTQSRYPNAGLRRPSLEIGEEQAKRSLRTAQGVINEVDRFITSKV